MAVITGITGAVTSWAGTQNTSLIATGVSPMQFNLTVGGPALDATAFDTTGAAAYVKDIYAWSGTIRGYLVVPETGTNGLVTYASGYAANLNSWTINISADSHEYTPFASTAARFAPGVFEWGGSYSGFLDGTTTASLPHLAAEPASATFKYQEKGGTDNTLTGTIITENVGIAVQPRALNSVSYAFRGTGALTQSTPSAGVGVFPAGAITAPVIGELVLTASTGRTFTGDAFWTGITITTTTRGIVTVEIAFQGDNTLAVG